METNSWVKPAMRVASAGLGAAVAGPLGGAIGGFLGIALGKHAAGLIDDFAKKFGEKAGEKLLDTGADSLTEKLKEPSTGLEGVYREALRLSLNEIHARAPNDRFDDWFTNWETCLGSSYPLNLTRILPARRRSPLAANWRRPTPMPTFRMSPRQ
jgi:hypothetical protein